MNKYNAALKNHYDSFWHSNDRLNSFNACGRITAINQDFEVLEIKPNTTRSMWTYATVGMADKSSDVNVELHVFSDAKNMAWVGILESIAYFHLTESRLGIGHTVNFGVGILEDSNLTHGLISLPFLDGPNLEIFNYEIQEISCLWLIPISQSELQYKKQYGLEALEKLFEKTAFAYSDPMRSSLV
jgi:hypothetical protein